MGMFLVGFLFGFLLGFFNPLTLWEFVDVVARRWVIPFIIAAKNRWLNWVMSVKKDEDPVETEEDPEVSRENEVEINMEEEE
jgi:hypothetical protein